MRNFIFLFPALLATIAFGFDHSRYKKINFKEFRDQTFKAIKSEIEGEVAPEGTLSLSTGNPYAFKLIFGGKCRSASPRSIDFFKFYDKSKGLGDHHVKLYSAECEFLVGSDPLWIPIQEVLVKDLVEETKIHKEVELYANYFGAFGGKEIYFGINDFQVQKQLGSDRLKSFTEKCKKSGDIEYCIEVGEHFEREKQPQVALEYFKIACEKRHPYGCEGVGNMYSDLKKNSEAKTFYKSACDLESRGACTNLGMMLGFETADAKSLFEKSCKLGDPMGCNNLGTWEYRYGNKQKGIGLWKSACKNGNENACRALKEEKITLQ